MDLSIVERLVLQAGVGNQDIMLVGVEGCVSRDDGVCGRGTLC